MGDWLQAWGRGGGPGPQAQAFGSAPTCLCSMFTSQEWTCFPSALSGLGVCYAISFPRKPCIGIPPKDELEIKDTRASSGLCDAFRFQAHTRTCMSAPVTDRGGRPGDCVTRLPVTCHEGGGHAPGTPTRTTHILPANPDRLMLSTLPTAPRPLGSGRGSEEAADLGT